MHETLINESESPYAIESDGTYVLLSPSVYPGNIELYDNAKINCINGNYSSDKVPLISKARLKEIIEREIFDETNMFRPETFRRL